jgi:hypothetical protein
VILTTLMAHPRKLIRHAVVSLFTSAGTAAGTRVKATRIEPHKRSQLPAISVYTLTDTVIEASSTNTEEAHELRLEVALWVAHTDANPADDGVDDLEEQVLAAMVADPYLGGRASSVHFRGTEIEIVEDDSRSDPIVAIATLTFEVAYRLDLTALADDLDDLIRVAATHDLVGGVPTTAPASDEFIVQETP